MIPFYREEYGVKNKDVVFFLAGWGNTIKDYEIFSKILTFFGYHCITYAYDPSILNPNIDETVQNLQKVKESILHEIELLRPQKNSFSVFGTSLGTVVSLLVANSSKDVSKVILNLSGAIVGDSIWGWGDKIFPDFHENFKRNNVTLFLLRKKWKKINPIENLSHLKRKKIMFISSKSDDIIPYSQAKKLLYAMKKRKLKVTVHTHTKLNHYWTAVFNLFFFPRYISFLKNTL